jgi:single-strand DNA-binding protein
MGRLTADPELKSTGSVSVCSFTLAVERRYKGQDEERQADFIRCVAWRERAEFLSRYFRKGNMVAVTGYIQVRKYEDKHGNNREAVEVVADQISFTGERRQDADAPPPPPKLAVPKGQSYSPSKPGYNGSPDRDFDEIEGDDDLPF